MNRFGRTPSRKTYTPLRAALSQNNVAGRSSFPCCCFSWDSPFPRHSLSKERLSARYLIPPAPSFPMPRSRSQTSRLLPSHQYVTNNDGNYTASNLPVGHYNMLVDVAGFKRLEQNNIVLDVGARDRYDFRLQVGSASEQVTVEGTAVAIQTESGEVSEVITGKQVEGLATNGRSIYTLINQTTGASSLQGDFQTPTPVGGDANVSFNGQRQGHNIYLLDGGEALDRGGSGTFAVMPSLESLSEFRALTSNYSADYGLSSAATLSTVIKSGTRTYHASAWEYNRNNVFDARNYFNPLPSRWPS